MPRKNGATPKHGTAPKQGAARRELGPQQQAALWQGLAEAQLEAQNWPAAIEACSALLQIEPRHHFAREILATALLHDGRIDESAAVMRELLLLSPRDPLHRLKLATLLQLQGQSGESLREFQRVADAHSGAPFAQEAQEAIESLDTIQIQQLLMRAGEQDEFARRLEREFDSTLHEHGFHLSEGGRESLRSMMGDGRPEPEAAPPRVH